MKSLYSLWILPPSDLKKELEREISNLSEKYNSPKFEAHITLLGNIESDKDSLIEKAKILASKIHPFPLILGEVSFSTTYFQSVLIRIKSAPLLMDANLLAKKTFNMENDVYMPHISLLYGDHNMELRAKIAKDLKLPVKKTFLAEEIIIIPVTQKPKDWKHLSTIPLKP